MYYREKRDMKILILYIYSDSAEYNDMLRIQRTYCNKFDDVESYFITYRNTQSNYVEIENDIVYVRGEETYLGITRKTIDTIEYLLNNLQYKVDYIVRTNMSTIVNIPKLKSFCNSISRENIYTSGNMNKLNWIDEPAGIIDDSLFGTIYASGTSIIMSNDVATSLIKNKQNIRHDIVDDVSIGVFMNTYLPHVFNINTPTANFLRISPEFNPTEMDTDAVFYRNRTGEDRTQDSKNMQMICQILYGNGENKESFANMNSDSYHKIMYYAGIALIIGGGGYIIYKTVFGSKKMRKLM